MLDIGKGIRRKMYRCHWMQETAKNCLAILPVGKLNPHKMKNKNADVQHGKQADSHTAVEPWLLSITAFLTATKESSLHTEHTFTNGKRNCVDL